MLAMLESLNYSVSFYLLQAEVSAGFGSSDRSDVVLKDQRNFDPFYYCCFHYFEMLFNGSLFELGGQTNYSQQELTFN